LFLSEFGLSSASSDEDAHTLIDRAATLIAEQFTSRFHTILHQLVEASANLVSCACEFLLLSRACTSNRVAASLSLSLCDDVSRIFF
jgi:hypothetical protein